MTVFDDDDFVITMDSKGVVKSGGHKVNSFLIQNHIPLIGHTMKGGNHFNDLAIPFGFGIRNYENVKQDAYSYTKENWMDDETLYKKLLHLVKPQDKELRRDLKGINNKLTKKKRRSPGKHHNNKTRSNRK